MLSKATTIQLVIRRSLAQQVRVRFAPSPTGKLHIGGLRTALYNYLFARKNKGLFILRIEDTDRERLKPESLPNINESLKWAGLQPDFGPENQNDKNSDLGPLFQSERLSFYESHAEQLVGTGKAYRCFCDPTRLELLRKNAAKRQEKIAYDGKCRHLSQAQIEKFLNEKKPHVIRFKLDGDEREVAFNDMAVGVHKSAPGKQEGDFVIMKSDGFPTYHFANVVDDHLMKITHVLRGQEWLLSTAKHILMYEAFGWQHPTYAHLPLLCNNDGTKISKRQNDIDVMWYRSRGYLPETLLAYLTTIGGGCRANIVDDDSFYQEHARVHENLVANFDEHKISNRAVKLNIELLENMNRRFLKSMASDEKRKDGLVNELRQILISKYSSINDHYLNETYLKSVLEWSLDRVHRLAELAENPDFSYLWTDASTSKSIDTLKSSSDLIVQLVDAIIKYLSECEKLVEADLRSHLSRIFNEIKKKTNHNSEAKSPAQNVWKLTRLILIGSDQGPPVAELFCLLGRENSIFRLNLAKQIILNKNK